MSDWISFWDSKHSVYVNERHLAAHYRRIADDLLPYVPEGGAVLDYGCGEALSHDRVAAVAGRLVLCDAAPGVRASLASRFRTSQRVEVDSPQDIDALPSGEFDLIVMHSVAQYLGDADFDRTISMFRRLLNPNGALVLGDIIPPDVSPITDATALLRFAQEEKFLAAAVLGLARTAVSNYARLRSTLGISQYSEQAMLERLTEAGYTARRAPKNIGHNPARMTFIAKPR